MKDTMPARGGSFKGSESTHWLMISGVGKRRQEGAGPVTAQIISLLAPLP